MDWNQSMFPNHNKIKLEIYKKNKIENPIYLKIQLEKSSCQKEIIRKIIIHFILNDNKSTEH